jgi:hypothetical protein
MGPQMTFGRRNTIQAKVTMPIRVNEQKYKQNSEMSSKNLSDFLDVNNEEFSKQSRGSLVSSGF